MRTRTRLLLLVLLFVGPAWSQFFGGAAGKSDRVTFVLCAGAPCQTGADKTNHFIITDAAKIKRCYITAKVAPTGAALVIDLKKNGVSILGTTVFGLAAGQAGPVRFNLTPVSASELQVISVDITQIGTTEPGQDVTVVCKLE